jgi:iron complex transport system ATP-binding protein
MTNELCISNIALSRGGKPIFTDLNATIAAGSVAALVGPNGAGKSTLLSAIAGLLPYEGHITRPTRRDGCSTVSFLPQAIGIEASLTVFETVLLGRLECLRWCPTDEDIAAATRALDILDLVPLADHRLDRLSGGQQQMVFLAQRLVCQPCLLLLDEPTSALDLRRQLVVLERVKAHAKDNDAVVVAALHDLTLAARIADVVLLVADRRLLAAGPPEDVLTEENLRYAYGIEAEILHGRDGRLVIAPMEATSSSLLH